MRTIALLAIMGLIAAAETPNPTPAKQPEPPKQATLDPLQLENLELKMALNKRAEQDIQTAYAALISRACESIGGKSAEDCIPLPREAGRPVVVQLKPVAVKK